MFAYALLHGVSASAITASLNEGPGPVGEKRYWRLLVEATIGDSTPPLATELYTGLTYLGLADVSGGPDLIDPGLYNVRGTSSPFFTGEEGYNVFRGPSNYSNGVVRGDSNGDHWYQWDFGSGSPQTIEEILLRPRKGYDNQHPLLFKVQASDDALNWLTAFSVDRRGDPTQVWYDDRIFKYNGSAKPADPGRDNAHRYWRVRCMTFFDTSYICISKAKFYHDKAHLVPIDQTGATFLSAHRIEGSAANAFDTGQIVANNSEYPWVLEVCYAAPVKVSAFSMFSRDGFGQAPNAMAIDYSDDGQNWYEAWSIPSQPAWALGEQRFFADPDAVDPEGDVYWRIYGTQRQLTTAQWAEMEWLATSGGSDMLAGGYTSSYGNYSSSFRSDYLVDNNDATSWATTGSGSIYPWWGYAFSEEPEPVQFVRFKGNSFSSTESWTRATIEKSEDGATWQLYGDITIPAVANGVWSAELPVTPVPALVPPTAPHRYWRFSIREGGANFQSVMEAELLDEFGNDLTALGGTASANVAQGGYPASQAFDNNPATRWYDNGTDGRWIQWDFGSGNAKLPYSWSLQCAANAPSGWDLMYSDDGTTWTVADRRLRLTWSSDRKVFAIPGMEIPDFTGSIVWDIGYTPVGAWGLRRLVSGYDGPLVRVRDTTTNAEQDVGMDSDGFLDTFTVTGDAAVVRVYDQTGGDDLIQTTYALQPLLEINATPNGRPAIKADGVDDFLEGAFPGTNRPYMVTNPLAIWMGGAGYGNPAHESYANIWNIPEAEGSNNSPYKRIGMNWSVSGSTDTNELEIRIASGAVSVGTRMISSRKNWGALAFSAAAGRLTQGGYPGLSNIGPSGNVTYPNETRMKLFANGENTENWGGFFAELTIFQAPGVTQAIMQDTISTKVDIGSTCSLFGENRLMGIVASNSFGGGNVSLAELKLYEAGSDVNVAESPLQVTALSAYSGSEIPENAFDGDPNTLWSAANGAWHPLLALLDGSAEIERGTIIARNDAFYDNTVSQFYHIYLDRAGWHNLPGVEIGDHVHLTSLGVVAGRSYGWTVTGGKWIEPPVGTTWTAVITPTLNSTSNDWAGDTVRQRIAPTALSVDGDFVRLTFEASSGGLKIDNMALGLSVSGFDFEATPVRVTFKGQNGFDIGANATIVSDPIPLAYVDSAEKALLLSYHIPSDAGAKSNMRINSSQTGWTRSYKGDVDETFTLTATGYTTSGGSVVIGVSKVEFGDAP